ncbi:MAG: nitrilase-related carbon-nitrogen hydrolase [Candidatus Lokiarchaeota archaeon]|jgi:predicted amidohydrolase
MRVGYIQTSPIFGEKEKNFTQINNLVSNTKADILVLPELFATGYTFVSKREVANFSENTEGITAIFLARLAKKTDALVIGGYIETSDKKIYNSAMIVSKEGVIGNYRKLHLYYKEKLWFSQGNLPLKIYKFKDFNIGVMICFDWFFPETMRSLALLGADIVAHPANLVLPYCQDAMVIRCLENKVYAITSNRIGIEKRGVDYFKFTGKSQITSYNGEILTSAPGDEIFIDITEIELENVRDKSINAYNHIFEDRRVEFYRNK